MHSHLFGVVQDSEKLGHNFLDAMVRNFHECSVVDVQNSNRYSGTIDRIGGGSCLSEPSAPDPPAG